MTTAAFEVPTAAGRQRAPSPGQAQRGDEAPGSRLVLLLPAAFALGLAALGLLPAAQKSRTVLWSFEGTALLLLAWCAVLALSSARSGSAPALGFVLRRPHWMQPLVHLSIFTYWGMHWPMVGESIHLIAAQLLFAYAFDQLLCWSHRKTYFLGFGPCPIVLSTNLFLWFKPDWFWLQFVLIACGFAAKEFLRWERDGQRVHIFNPSSFPLAVASLIFILFGGVDLTYGREIANTIGRPDHMFELLFLLSLPAQLIFGVALMTVPALLTTFSLSVAYDLFTGSSYFFGTIPTPAFLGLLLLFTDPSTSPKSELGRVLYGVLYGLSVFVLYGLLDWLGTATIYDKLLFVPALNLSVRALDRLAAAPWLQRFNPARLLPHLRGLRRNFAITTVWAVVFLGVRAAHGVGDLHPANRLPFWEKACAESRRNGCRQLATMEGTFCQQGSGWACNEMGLKMSAPGGAGFAAAERAFTRACQQGYRLGCTNGGQLVAGVPRRSGPPQLTDYQVVLDPRGLGPARGAQELLQQACAQGWKDACAALGAAPAAPAGDAGGGAPESVKEATAACRAGDLQGCRALGRLLRQGKAGPPDEKRALACQLGVVEGCAPREP